MRVRRRTTLASGLSLAVASLTSRIASAQGMMNRSYEDGFTVLASDPRFTGWVSLLQQSGLAPNARGSTPYTMFAPTNAAISQRPDVSQMLLPTASESFPDTSGLITLVRAHVIYGLHPLEEFRGKKVTLSSISGTPIEIDGSNPQAITVTWQSVEGQKGQGTLQGQPILANNADIYPIDAIMFKRR